MGLSGENRNTGTDNNGSSLSSINLRETKFKWVTVNLKLDWHIIQSH